MIYDNISFTPEPTSAMLLGLSGLVLLRRRRR
ncbi:MAG: PEP-CTERM sorting domain-containing protein [Akkermansiaceae bacterium]|nr:PEP-CTERM sorting domain-containing protein [Akkermansiaceae bacterium]